MKHSETEILSIAKPLIEKYQSDYNPNFKFQARFNPRKDLSLIDLEESDTWTVTFQYGELEYGTWVTGFLVILDDNLKPLYFNTRGGLGVLSDEHLEGLWP